MKAEVFDIDECVDILGPDSRELLDIIGASAFVKVIETFGGNSIYIPKADNFDRIVRDKEICKLRRKGLTTKQLASRYGLTPVSIVSIVNKEYKSRRK